MKTMCFILGRTANVACVGLALLLGCGSSAPTKNLVDARKVYGRAKTNETTQILASKEFQAAKRALDQAEAAHKDDPGSEQERDLAYIAYRRVEFANAQALARHERTQREALESQYGSGLEGAVSKRSSELQSTRGELQSAKRALASEREARLESEEKIAAMESLGDVGSLKEDSRGAVLTVSNAVLFGPKREPTLAPNAREKLHQVAEVLKARPQRKILIESYTDSRGSDASNERISQKRADTVRALLIAEGVEESRIVAVGKGESNPIADNSSSDGRANNRRVEIILEGPSPTNPPNVPRQANR